MDKKALLRKWPETHKKHWRRLGYTKAPAEHPVAKRFKEQWPLTKREEECLNYVCIKHAPPPGDVVCADLSQSINRIPMALNMSTCITPSAKIIALFNSDFENVDQNKLESRPLLGVELLRLQGMSLQNLPNVSALNNFSCKEMTNLAGNAFSTPQMTVAFLIALDVLGEFMPKSKSELKQLRQKLKQTKLPSDLSALSPTKSDERSEIFHKRMTKVPLCMCVCYMCFLYVHLTSCVLAGQT